MALWDRHEMHEEALRIGEEMEVRVEVDPISALARHDDDEPPRADAPQLLDRAPHVEDVLQRM